MPRPLQCLFTTTSGSCSGGPTRAAQKRLPGKNYWLTSRCVQGGCSSGNSMSSARLRKCCNITGATLRICSTTSPKARHQKSPTVSENGPGPGDAMRATTVTQRMDKQPKDHSEGQDKKQKEDMILKTWAGWDMCGFLNTKKGCRFGDQCRNLHICNLAGCGEYHSSADNHHQ